MDSYLASMAHTLRRWLETNGLDAEAIYRHYGISRAVEADENHRIPAERINALVHAILGQLPDACAGLRAARCWHPSDLGAFGYAWLASSTLRKALERRARFEKVLGLLVRIELVDVREGLKVVFRQEGAPSEYGTLAVDYGMAILLDMCRFNFGDALKPQRVTLRRSEPDCSDRHRSFYGCQVAFSNPENSFILSTTDVDQLLPSSNKRLAGMHDRVLMEQLAELDKSDFVARCRAYILENLANGEASIEEAAKALHVSPRTLNRRLVSLGTTFAKIYDDTRRELAARYLRDPGQPIVEIAFQLGYSHQSSLARASKRWFGMSPREYRQQPT